MLEKAIAVNDRIQKGANLTFVHEYSDKSLSTISREFCTVSQVFASKTSLATRKVHEN